MKIHEIHINDDFTKQFLKLPEYIQNKAKEKERLFRLNPFHLSLRLHKLKGKLEHLWSISIDMGYRIIFEPLENGNVLFVSVGKHDIYEK